MELGEQEEPSAQSAADKVRETLTRITPLEKSLSTAIVAGVGSLAKLARLYKTDASKENNGADLDLGEGIIFGVRSQHSRIAREKSKELARKWTAQTASGVDLTLDQNDQFNEDLASEALVSYWNLTDDQDQAIACTPENVRDVLSMLPHALERVMEFSGKIRNYK